MSRVLFTPVLAVLAISTCRPANQTDFTSSAADSLAIVQLRDRFSEAINQGDIEGVLATIDSSLVIMPPNGDELFGLDGLRAFLEPSFEQFRWEATYPSGELRVAGDWAFDRGSYELTLLPKEGESTPRRSEGKRLWILRRQADGSWRISHIMFSQRVLP